MMSCVKLFSVVLFASCMGAQCNVNPEPKPEPDPSGVTVEQACQNVVALGCTTQVNCVSTLQDIMDASVDPELRCILEAKSCDQVESCN